MDVNSLDIVDLATASGGDSIDDFASPERVQITCCNSIIST